MSKRLYIFLEDVCSSRFQCHFRVFGYCVSLNVIFIHRFAPPTSKANSHLKPIVRRKDRGGAQSGTCARDQEYFYGSCLALVTSWLAKYGEVRLVHPAMAAFKSKEHPLDHDDRASAPFLRFDYMLCPILYQAGNIGTYALFPVPAPRVASNLHGPEVNLFVIPISMTLYASPKCSCSSSSTLRARTSTAIPCYLYTIRLALWQRV